MPVIIAAIVGFLTARMLWMAMRPSWQRPAFIRTNYQGVSMPTAVGAVIVFSIVAVEAIRGLLAAAGIGSEPGLTAIRSAALVAVVGFALLGLIDDLAGTTRVRGLAGHLEALGRGEFTTGAMKLFIGAAIAIVVSTFLSPGGLVELLADAALIALMANFINLVDLRPGRASKVGLLIFGVLTFVAWFDKGLVPVAIVVGAAAALMLDDLHERLMIGDTGANALGAAIGLGLATQLETSGTLIAVAVLVVFTLVSEMVSFTKVIDRIAPLRSFDNLGRRRPQQSTTIDVRDSQTRPFTPRSHGMSTPIRATVGGASATSSRFPRDSDAPSAARPQDLFSSERDDSDKPSGPYGE